MVIFTDGAHQKHHSVRKNAGFTDGVSGIMILDVVDDITGSVWQEVRR